MREIISSLEKLYLRQRYAYLLIGTIPYLSDLYTFLPLLLSFSVQPP